MALGQLLGHLVQSLALDLASGGGGVASAPPASPG